MVSVNPEVLRIELALSVAQSREGVPYPALVEIIMLLIILELIMEASVRLPKSIGPTITMVGGIILGQAAVEAKLVSNLLIIILAATTIANSTVVGFQNSNSIRLFKYLIVLMASMFGILGILAGIFIICTYLASVKTFGIPFINLSSSKGEMNSG
ncbi:spore germination protein [Bacillus litorisediminis]|uniref:spore germination protein n=1 Tax=Bacillus litorisediminis TaxID=2922713 RepID=UPI002435B71B|nr:spore germination protein [Bacillus litorisediminis]